MPEIPNDRIIDFLKARINQTDLQIYKYYYSLYEDIVSQIGSFYRKYDLPRQSAAATWSVVNEGRRLEALKMQVQQTINDMLYKVGYYIEKQVGFGVQDGYYLDAWNLSSYAGKLFPYPLLDTNFIESAVNNDMSKITDPSLMGNERGRAIRDIREAVTLGMGSGESYGKISDRIAGVLGVDPEKAKIYWNEKNTGYCYRFMRIARTEGHRTQMLGQNKAFLEGQDMGLDIRLKFRATLDDRVRDAHAAMDGDLSNGKGEFYYPTAGGWYLIANTGIAKLDIQCRCNSTTVWEGMPEHKMRASYPDDIPKDITFEDWAEMMGITENRYGQKYEFVA